MTVVGCVSLGPNVIVCGESSDAIRVRRFRHCKTCGKRQHLVELHEFWHGRQITCTGCGDSWSPDYGPAPQPSGDWRPAAVVRARAEYARAVHASGLQPWQNRLMAELAYTGEGEE